MKLFFKLILVIVFSSIVNASPARSGLHIFTQADGTQFEGVLKGDSSFHWIESNSKVVFYNSKDKFYYYADFNANHELILTNEKPKLKHTEMIQRVSGVISSKENSYLIDSDTKKALQKMQNKSRKGHHPR